MTRVLQFILVFDKANGSLVVEQFGDDVESAVARYDELEQGQPDDRSTEIVLLGADSIDTLRTTHPHYFNKERDTDSLTQLEERVREERSAS